LMVNNAAGDPSAMGQDGTPEQPTIGAVMLGLSDRAAIRGDAGSAATVDGSSFVEVLTHNENFLASFSSRGPSNLLDIKPDVTGPGVNVYSSIPGGRFAMFQGTSMATPHVAGSSALLRQLHPDWTPAQIKSALVDTASRPANLSNGASGTTNPQNRGGGILDLSAVTTVSATLDPATLSFRKIEPTSGRSKTIDVTVTNVTSRGQTFSASAAITRVAGSPSGVSASVSPSSLTLGPGASGTLSVTVDTSQTSPSGQYWGDLTVTGGGSTLKAPLWFAVRTFVDAGPLQ
jgi:minor extracellular serine protease Vpr